ncbi:glycosyltransferase family A protein [Microbacterium sp. H1-D42]|uniref:glycosyltransferase family 2 protein n=1 Tax=Microbacterium sp. H1-D42 TaxID=2925844 RepID=UPI001F53611D|nr:glycosyltransferase family A protein [Microbacterium sp. H1-D42]UNK71048.1 glycosyltransferase family 2 protein [Microbacterium sp. H1-D42]
MIKVSVVVPTYKTAPEGLQRLVDSLDGQTMPSDEFEVIFIDDGSPDDTFERLKMLQSSHANVQLDRIENSGWPSRPRNVGIDKAQGEYVLFMDHDDTLYPDALRAGYELAKGSDADVLSGKEVRTDDAGWVFDSFEKDERQALDRDGDHPLTPLNPHKLYRRRLLEEYSIRFPEGRLVLWEDQFFNLRVARYAKVMSRLASVPFYHWVTTAGSGTTLFDVTQIYYWQMLRRLCEAVDVELSGPDRKLLHEQIARLQYGARVLGAYNVGYAKRSVEARRMIFAESRALREDFELSRFDDSLSVSVRLRAQLVGADRQDLLERLCSEDVAIAGWGTARSMTWHAGVLEVTTTVEWSSAQGRRPTLRRKGERILKVLSPELSEAFSDDDRDMTAEVSRATGAFAIRNREDKVVWSTPSTWSVHTEEAADGSVRITGALTTTIDPSTAAHGSTLESTYWDLQTRVRLGSALTHRNLRSDLPPSASFVKGRLHLVYPNDGGHATLIPDGQAETVRRLTPLSATQNEDGRVRVHLSGVHDGQGSIATVVGLDASAAIDEVDFVEHPAVLDIDGGQATLTFDATSKVMRVRIGDRIGRRPKFWTLFVTPPEIELNVGQFPKIRTTDEIVAEDQERERAAAAAAESNAGSRKPEGDAPNADQSTPKPGVMRRIRRRCGKLLRSWGLR